MEDWLSTGKIKDYKHSDLVGLQTLYSPGQGFDKDIASENIGV